MTRHFLAYLNHAALNAGAALGCIFHCVVPPQLTGHTAEDVDGLAKMKPWRAFWRGMVD